VEEQVVERMVTIRTEAGLHARPAALFVQAAAKYSSRLSVLKDGREANAKSILEVLALGAGRGSVVTLKAEGPDEDAAMERLVSILSGDI
jgi:phosphotransferase system HPr (HPr) family protein